jgi:transposase
MRKAKAIILTPEQRQELEKLARSRRSEVRVAQRARIVLLASQGRRNKEIGAILGIDRRKAGRWRDRYAEAGVAGILKDLPRGGRKPVAREKVAPAIIHKTTQERPKNATHWSTRTLAREVGTSAAMVQRVWKAAGLKPHRVKTFKLSNDPHFVEKLLDVVGLYLNPPEHALVLCADEKSQIQALDRTQPGLPLKKGRCGTMTHDYKRNGTTTLFAAIELAEGKLIGTCMKKHRHQEWLKFLRLIHRETPKYLDLHLIVDNYRTHKHQKVKDWLNRHPRFHVHFIPTSSSWLNLIERWFRDLTDKRIRRGTFTSVPELVEAIMDYINQHNADPKGFTWTAKAEDILAKVERARAVLISAKQNESLH